MNRRRLGRRLCLSVLLTLAACSTPDHAATRASLIEVEPIALDAMEPNVQQQLRAARAALDALLTTDPSPTAELGEAYGDLGRLYQAYELPQPAIACYRNAQQLQPEVFRWAYLLGYLLYLEGDLRHAASALDEALRLRPDDPPASLWAGHTALGRGLAEAAIPFFERAIQADAACAGARFGLGEAARESRRPEDAIVHYRNVLEQQPAAARVHYSLARALQSIGRDDEAAQHFDLAASQGPARGGWAGCADPEITAVRALADSSAAAVLRGSAASLGGSVSDEIVEYRNAVAKRSDDPVAHHALASALWETGDVEGAVSHFEQALGLRPDDATLNYDFGFVLARTGDLKRAEQLLLRAVELHPDYVEAHLMLGTLYQRHGHLQTALMHYNRVLARAPHQLTARLQRALTLAELKRRPEAVADLQQLAVEAPPSDPQEKLNLASALGMLGDTERSSELLRQLAIAPGAQPTLRARAHFNLGMLALGQQSPRKAIEHFRQASQLDPDFDDAQRGLREAQHQAESTDSQQG